MKDENKPEVESAAIAKLENDKLCKEHNVSSFPSGGDTKSKDNVLPWPSYQGLNKPATLIA